MTSALSPQSLEWLLEDFIRRVPQTECALLAARDGLKKAAHGLTADQADTMSAVMSGLHSLARSVGEIKDRRSSGAVRQVVVEHDDALLFVMSAGEGSLLGVQAAHGADPGVVGYEMTQLINSVFDHLGTPTRQGGMHAVDAGR